MKATLFILTLLAALPLFAEEPKAIVINGPTPIEIMSAPYKLYNMHEEVLKQGDRKGEFTFESAVKLMADTYRFGGFSGLAMADGVLYAVTDEGTMLRARLAREKGPISGLKDALMAPLWPDNRPPTEKADYDAESLTWLKKGTEFMVAFEQQHRLVHYDLGKDKKGPFIFRTRMVPPDVAALMKPNGGIEAIVQLDKESYAVFSETSRDPAGNLRGWIAKGDAWEMFNIKPTGNFVITDAAPLPNGNILLLERSYSLLRGLKSRITLVKRADIKPGAMLEPKQLVLFGPESNNDNFEGITVLPPEKDGSVTVLLISDDNFNPMQNTVLVALKLAKDRF